MCDMWTAAGSDSLALDNQIQTPDHSLKIVFKIKIKDPVNQILHITATHLTGKIRRSDSIVKKKECERARGDRERQTPLLLSLPLIPGLEADNRRDHS